MALEGGGVELSKMQTVQLSIADAVYAASVRDALSRNCAWRVETVQSPDPSQHQVLVLDEAAFARLPLPLSNPERVVLITHKQNSILADAWDAGIVSVVFVEDPVSTVLLAIMAAALRIDKSDSPSSASGISPNPNSVSGPISPDHRTFGSKR